jgi:hypothetical protein
MLVGLMILGCLTALGAAIIQWFKEKKSGEKHHNYTLIFVFVGTVLATITSIMQSIESEKSEAKLVESYNELKSKSDSNSIQIIKSLAEYGIQYDDVQRRIVKLVKDSMRTMKTTIVQSESPTLILASENGKMGLELMNDKLSFKYTFSSRGATSKNVNLLASFAVSNNFNVLSKLNNVNDYIHDGNASLLNEITVPKDLFYSGSILRDSTIQYKFQVIWFRGTYQNNDKTNIFIYDEMVLYDYENNSSTYLVGELKNKLVNWFNTKERRK